MMIKLVESRKYWGSDNFPDILKKELIKLGTAHLPLQKAATPGSFIRNSDIGVGILSIADDDVNIKAKIGVMFPEILWAYCCGDDEPMVNDAYCEFVVVINKTTAAAKFKDI